MPNHHAESFRARKMMKRLGMRPVLPASKNQNSVTTGSRLKPSGPHRPAAGANERSDAASVSSFTPSELNTMNIDYVKDWVTKLPTHQASLDEHHRPPNNRKRKLLPQQVPSSTVIRAEISSPDGKSLSCSLTINSKGVSPASSAVVSVEIDGRTANREDVVDPKVIRDLFAAREAILAKRKQEEERSSVSEDNESDGNYEPSNKNSSDSGSDIVVTSNKRREDKNQKNTSVPFSGPGDEDEEEEDDPQEVEDDDNHLEDNDDNLEDDDNNLEDDDNNLEDNNNNGDDEEDDSPPRKKRFKRRIRQTLSSSRRERQRARNCGEAYTNSSGKEVASRKNKPLPDCRKKCSSRLTPEECSELCKDFWGLEKLDRRSIYMTNLIEVAPKSSQRLNPTVSPARRKNRQYTMKYHVVLNGSNIEVCKGCFINIFDVSSKYLEGLVKHKMNSTAGTLPTETRGQSSGTAVALERLNCVIEHLNSFPKYVSHYARNKTDKNFLSSNLTMKSMFEAYLEKYPEKPVSRWIYEREFHRLNLSIKPLKADTCNKCDTLETAVIYARTEAEKTAAKAIQELHHRKAEKAKKQKKDDIDSLLNKPETRVIAFDLQQCLPTPHLQTSVVFYKRQLWVYNLTIHDCGSGKSWHNMWHEGEAERGPNEVGSALYNYLMHLPDEVEEAVLWSDTCGGQNKNSIICAVLQTVLQNKKTLKVIDQKFLVSGHTFMDCDTDHSVIEGKKRKAQGIHLPRDWYNLVRNSSKNFTVQLMDQTLQLDFKKLLKGRESPLVKRKKNTDKEKFVWKDVVWLRHSRKLPAGTLAYKATHEKEAPFLYLDLKRYKKTRLDLKPTLTYDGPRSIKQKKKNDLLELLHLIDPECRPFYLQLRGDGEDDNTPEFDPDLLPTTDEEESGEE